jgi:threonine dehydrogenase-like Zn-dependent dehydrogenase
MRALSVKPRVADSAAITEVAEPAASDGTLLVEMLAVGVCGTDREIIDGSYGEAPHGDDRLVIGHESLGRVLEAPAESGFAPGDLVVGIVRRPDPVPCNSCAAGEWDMCRNGRYTERGIKGRHGYASQRARLEPAFAVKIDAKLGPRGVLLEPASVVAKAWDHVDRIGHRAEWMPRKVTVTGAGPVGLLAALMGVERGLDVHVLDRVTEGPKPAAVRMLGATYDVGSVADACADSDVIIECTGAGRVVLDAMCAASPSAIVCLAGISSGHRRIEIDAAALNDRIVLENNVVFGSVNANRRHFVAAHEALMHAEPDWLDALITRRIPFEEWARAFEERSSDDIKTVIELVPSL